MAGYELVHHGEGRWNGVAIAAPGSASIDIVTNFGDGPCAIAAPAPGLGEDDFDPFDEARMLSAVVGGDQLVASTRRMAESSAARSTRASSAGSSGYAGGSTRPAPRGAARPGGDYNVTPADEDVWDPSRRMAGPTSRSPSATRSRASATGAFVDAYRLIEERAVASAGGITAPGMFHRNEGMRIDLLYVTKPVAERVVWAGDRPRSAQGPAGALGSRAGGHRPRRSREVVRWRAGTRRSPGSRRGRGRPATRVPRRSGTRRSGRRRAGAGP